jgi:hypothetical protein
MGSQMRAGQSFRARHMDKMLGGKAIFPALSRGDHECGGTQRERSQISDEPSNVNERRTERQFSESKYD